MEENISDHHTGKADLSLASEENYAYLYKYAIRKINDSELAKDLVQDTFLTALESLSRFEGRSSELTWLTAILKYKIFRVYRKRKAQLITWEEDTDFLSAGLTAIGSDGTTDQLDRIVDREFNAAIGIFLETLPVKWKQLYHLKYVRNEKTAVICHHLEITAENYWVLSYRLKAALKKWYLKTWLAE